MRFFTAGIICLVCMAHAVDASLPAWIRSVEEGCGVINTKPDANEKCRYWVCGTSIEIDSSNNRTIWDITVSPYREPEEMEFDSMRENLTALLKEQRREVSEASLRRAARQCNEEMIQAWWDDFDANFVRVHGTAVDPGEAHMVTIQQRTDGQMLLDVFIVDPGQKTVWKRKQ